MTRGRKRRSLGPNTRCGRTAAVAISSPLAAVTMCSAMDFVSGKYDSCLVAWVAPPISTCVAALAEQLHDATTEKAAAAGDQSPH
jgi:hypothetical protein